MLLPNQILQTENGFYLTTLSLKQYRCHWIKGNIEGDSVEKGEEIVQYMGPAPPQGSGKHRYVIAVFKQPKKLEFTKDVKRPKWKLMDFVKKHNLELVGVTYYFSENP